MARRRLEDEEIEVQRIDYEDINSTLPQNRNHKVDLLLEVEVTESLYEAVTAEQQSAMSEESLVEVTIIEPKEGSSEKESKPFPKCPSKIEERRDLERKLAEIKEKLDKLSNESLLEGNLSRKMNIDYRPIKSEAAARRWLKGLVKKSASADVRRGEEEKVAEHYHQLFGSMKDLGTPPVVPMKPGRMENITANRMMESKYWSGDGEISRRVKDGQKNPSVMSENTPPNIKLPQPFQEHRNQSIISSFVNTNTGVATPARVDGKIDYDANMYAKNSVCLELPTRLQHENVDSDKNTREKTDVCFCLQNCLQEKKVDDGAKVFEKSDANRLQQTKFEDNAKAHEDLGIYSDIHKRLQEGVPQKEVVYNLQLVTQENNAQTTKGQICGISLLGGNELVRRVEVGARPRVETCFQLPEDRVSLIDQYLSDVNYKICCRQSQEKKCEAELPCTESVSSRPSEIYDFCGIMDYSDTNYGSAGETTGPTVKRALIPLSSRERMLGYRSADEQRSKQVFTKPLSADQATDTEDDIRRASTNLIKPKYITPQIFQPNVMHFTTHTALQSTLFQPNCVTDKDSFDCIVNIGESENSVATNKTEDKGSSSNVTNESKQLVKDDSPFNGKPKDTYRATYESVGVQTSFHVIVKESVTNDSLKDNAKKEYDSANGSIKQHYLSKGLGNKKVLESPKSQIISSDSDDCLMRRGKSVYHREKLRRSRRPTQREMQPEKNTNNAESQDKDALEKSTNNSIGNSNYTVVRIQNGAENAQEKRHHKSKGDTTDESVKQHDKLERSSHGKQTHFEDNRQVLEKLYDTSKEVYFNIEHRNEREKNETKDRTHRNSKELSHSAMKKGHEPIGDDDERNQHRTPEVTHQRGSRTQKEKYPSSYNNSSERSHRQSDNQKSKSPERSIYSVRKRENTCKPPMRRRREIESAPEASRSFESESQDDAPPTASDTELESLRSMDSSRTRGATPESRSKKSILPKAPDDASGCIWTWDGEKLTPGFDLKSGVEKLLLDHLEKKCKAGHNPADSIFKRKSDHLTYISQDVEQELCRKLREYNKVFMDNETLCNLINTKKMLQEPAMPHLPLVLTPKNQDSLQSKTQTKVCRQEYVALTSPICNNACNDKNSLHLTYLNPFSTTWNSTSRSCEPALNTGHTSEHGDCQNVQPAPLIVENMSIKSCKSGKSGTSVSKPATISLTTSQETFNSYKEMKRLREERMSRNHDGHETKHFLKCKVSKYKLRTNSSEQSLTRTKQSLDCIRRNSKTSIHLNRTSHDSTKKCVVGKVKNYYSNGDIEIEIELSYRDLEKLLWHRQKRRKRLSSATSRGKVDASENPSLDEMKQNRLQALEQFLMAHS